MISTRKFNGNEIELVKKIRITGTGALAVNVFKVVGTIRVVDQFAVITEITTLNNATGIYSVLDDGTKENNLTKDGAVLSGLPVGTSFLKDLDTLNEYSVLDATEGQVSEVLQDNKAGKPFTVQQKSGVDTFIKLYLTTTDNPVDFEIELTFVYEKKGSTSELIFLL